MTPGVDSPATKFLSLWAINGPLEGRRLRTQLDQMKASGLDGAVFHPRFYPNQPEYLTGAYLADVSDAILHAKSIGLDFWIYDENGWPSGTAGGKLLREYPDDAASWLELSPDRSPTTVFSFVENGSTWRLNRRTLAGIDCLSPGACEHFLSITHEAYRTGLSPAAWEHVTAFFSDEPEMGLSWDTVPKLGAIPWTSRMTQRYAERFGEDLPAALPSLFFKRTGYREFRLRFWEWATELFCEGFFDPYRKWCEKHGKIFTAHVKGEEHPLFQVPMAGSCHQVFRHIGLPGIDALERFPSNDFFPRQLASVARQFGNGRCMAECFGGAGWGATPEDLERYLLWLGRHGVTDFALHLSQYQLTSHAIHDWPPSFPHLNWRAVLPDVLRSVRAILDAETRPPADTLVVSPYRGIMSEYEPRELEEMNIHNAGTYADTPAGRINRRFLDLVQSLHSRGVAIHFADEATFEEAEVSRRQLRIGNCRYSRIVLPDACVLSERGKALVAALEAAGIPIDADGPEESPVVSPTSSSKLPSVTTVRPQWRLEPGQLNHLVLEPRGVEGGWWSVNFVCQTPCELGLRFADDVVEVRGADQPLQIEEDETGKLVRLPLKMLSRNNGLLARFQSPIVMPFVWLQGAFSVRSGSAFLPGPNHTLMTDGPFVIDAGQSPLGGELTASGYPFCKSPLKLEAMLDASALDGARQMQLIGVFADAVRAFVDDEDLGFSYGPHWQVTIPRALQFRLHILRLELIPSTFNFYGPHRHIDGDRHVVSPDQFIGKKNFADRLDAPEFTLGKSWHFLRVRPPTALTIGR
jgi:hypothetical protein